MSTPIAQEIKGDIVVVDPDLLAKHLAQTQAKLLKEKNDLEMKEITRLADEKIKSEKAENNKRVEHLNRFYRQQEEQQDADWVIENPQGAMERLRAREKHRLQDQFEKNEDLKRKLQMEREQAESYRKRREVDAEEKIKLEHVHRREWLMKVRVSGGMLVGMGCGLWVMSFL